MARYFFNIVVRGRKAIPDPEGDELANDKAARDHAKIVARDMLNNRIWYKRGLEHWVLEITNVTGRRIALVRFAGELSKGPLSKPKGATEVSEKWAQNRQ